MERRQGYSLHGSRSFPNFTLAPSVSAQPPAPSCPPSADNSTHSPKLRPVVLMTSPKLRWPNALDATDGFSRMNTAGLWITRKRVGPPASPPSGSGGNRSETGKRRRAGFMSAAAMATLESTWTRPWQRDMQMASTRTSVASPTEEGARWTSFEVPSANKPPLVRRTPCRQMSRVGPLGGKAFAKAASAPASSVANTTTAPSTPPKAAKASRALVTNSSTPGTRKIYCTSATSGVETRLCTASTTRASPTASITSDTRASTRATGRIRWKASE
mmetsp:Transcript_94184/g.209275  ORF Transcript_94184/g.209275 Transcript_94184/m.209275 type:complete len:273 (+) Transcript_94184:60-878(+)